MPNMQLILLVILVVAAIAISEVVSLVYNHKHVTFRCEIDMNLTEPGEIVTLTYHIQNRSWFPVSFASFCFQFPDVVEVQERPEWLALHHVGSKSDRMYSFDVNLRPHHGIRGKLHFSIRERGLFELGKVYIETGDFLGFSSKVRSITLYDRIICTASSLPQDPAVQPMGGFLGDLSVRRFIMEDPSLILGYRDYTGAEPMKSISWIQTARTGRLTVKKHDFTVDTDVSVLVDLEQCQKQLAERCLSLVRTVCDVLEEQRIAYSVLSNGDLFQTAKGIGRMHTFEVQKRIGLSRFVRYQHFDDLLSQWARPGFSQRGCIVIAPKRTEELGPALVRLENATGANICLLIGEEVGRDAEL